MLNANEIKIIKDKGWDIKDECIEKKFGNIWATIPYETIEDIIEFDFDEDEFINTFYQANGEYSPEGLYNCATQILNEVVECSNELDELIVGSGIEFPDELKIEEILDYYSLELEKKDGSWVMNLMGYAPAFNELLEYEYDFGYIKDVNQLQQGINEFLRNFDKENFVKEKMEIRVNHEYPLTELFVEAEDIMFDILDLQEALDEKND